MLMRRKGPFVVVGVLAWTLVASVALAQDSQEPSEAPADQAVAPEEEEEAKGGLPFGLYVYASAGSYDADPFNTSIQTSSSNKSENTLTLDGMKAGRAEIGWKLPNKKGDFRLTFQGYAEDGYNFTAFGRAAQLPSGQGSSNLNILDDLDWWTIVAEDGRLTATRNPPNWNLAMDDANGNNSVDRDEVRYVAPDITNQRNITNDLQNRVQHFELTYGRAFGGRRYSGRWWSGLRYYEYEGNVPAGAWVNTALPGEGFTDGSTLRLLNLYQQASGIGPTGALEADFNFFENQLVFFLKGQAAFLIADLEVDSGPFFTLVNTTGANQQLVVPVAARLTESRDKSTWQTSGEIGVRVNLKIGVTLELAWNITGYLDTQLFVSSIQIPDSLGQAEQGTSAIYNTHDVVMDGARFGVGFQF